MASRFVPGAAAGLVLVFAAACGGGAPAATGPGSATARPAGVVTPPPPAQATCIDPVTDGEQVDITDHTFPDEVTVSVGETITWNNNDDLNHTISFRSDPDCGIMLVSQSIGVSFDAPGRYEYFCQFYRPAMAGVVIVE